MDDILKTLYYVELEETKILSQNRETNHSAYENLLSALSDAQKALFFTYEEKNNTENCEYGAEIYRCGFQSGFRLAQELLSISKK